MDNGVQDTTGPVGSDEEAPKILAFGQERIRVLHYTWIAFFMTFYVWFNMAPLATTMLDTVGWLTKEHLKILAICNVALTIPARIVVGALIDRYGSRIVFSALMVVMAVPAIAFAFGNSFMQLMIARLVLSSVGAGFVVGIKMVSQWFPPKYIGRAEGFYAGWGNFGSAFAAMTLPWFALSVLGGWFGLEGEDPWRYAMAINGIVMAIYGVMYYFLVKDVPEGKTLHKAAKTEPMMCTSYVDLVQYLAWSVPLIGALGVLAWRVSSVRINEIPGVEGSGTVVLPATGLWIIYGALVAIYIVHAVKTLQVNLPYLRKGVPEDEKYHWGSVAALNGTYFANFGAELAVVSMLPAFYETTFKPLTNGQGMPVVTATVAGFVAASFAFVNLVARPLGGYLSDKMANRKRVMMIYMAGVTIGFFLMAFISKSGWTTDEDGEAIRGLIPTFDGIWWLVVAVVITVGASVFVQGAEGSTYALIPTINKRMTGQIAGMAGAYGNVGAVIYLVVFSLVDAKTFFLVLSGGALASVLLTLFLLREPKGTFSSKMEYGDDLAPSET